MNWKSKNPLNRILVLLKSRNILILINAGNFLFAFRQTLFKCSSDFNLLYRQGLFMLLALYMTLFLQFLDNTSFLLHKDLELDSSSFWSLLNLPLLVSRLSVKWVKLFVAKPAKPAKLAGWSYVLQKWSHC